MKEHMCTLKHVSHLDLNEVEDLTLKERLKRMFEINANTPGAKKYFYSQAAVRAERRKQENLGLWWIIHPFSSWRIVWDLMMTVIFMIAFLSIPFSACFIVMSHDKIRVDSFNLLIYTFCWLDILCNCFTGYYDGNEINVELAPKKIFKHYLKTFLPFDVISSIPWDRITLPWRRLPGDDTYYLVGVINLLNCLKLSRYGYVNVQILQIFQHFDIQYFYYELFTTFMLGFYIMYWSCCLCYYLPVSVLYFTNMPPEQCPECWFTGLDYDSITFRFQYALFIVVEKLSASGYGGYAPKTDGLFSLSCFLMIVGRVLECYITAMLIQIKAGRKASESKFQEIINQLSAYTKQKQLSKSMENRLLVYYHYRFRNTYFQQLRQEIALQSSHRLVENVAIFKSLALHDLRTIVKNLRFELYLPNDVIVKAGAPGDCMFFLAAGTVAVLTPTGKEVCHLDDGAHFGEIALLVPEQRRVASVIAIEVCEVYRLDRKDFRKCIAVHTELFSKIERIAAERLERSMVIEEQHKRYLMRYSLTNGRRKSIAYQRALI